MKNFKALAAELVALWLSYQDSGTPYGNTFNGFVEWLMEQNSK